MNVVKPLFRSKFVPKVPITSWFPGHMLAAMKRMQAKLSEMDCLIEVHDARIPLSGRNPNLRQFTQTSKPHILILNKKDLTDLSDKEAIEESLQHQGISQILYTNLTAKKDYLSGFDKIIPSIVNLVRCTDRYNRSESQEINVMIIGIPNVGKSCLINRVRKQYKKGFVAKVGGSAGVTTAVQERIKLSSDPTIYILDTPGILEPKFKSIDNYMRIALVSSMSDDVVGHELIADYALYWLNRNNNFRYLDYFEIGPEPSDHIDIILTKIAMKNNLMVKYRDLQHKKIVNRPDLKSAAALFVKAFRTGKFGLVMLDNDILRKKGYKTADHDLPFKNDVVFR